MYKNICAIERKNTEMIFSFYVDLILFCVCLPLHDHRLPDLRIVQSQKQDGFLYKLLQQQFLVR